MQTDQIYPHLSQAAVFICEVFIDEKDTLLFLFFRQGTRKSGKRRRWWIGGWKQRVFNTGSVSSVPNYLFGRIKGRFASNRDLLQLITVNRGRVEEVEVSLKDNIDNIMDELYPQHECTSHINSRLNH